MSLSTIHTESTIRSKLYKLLSLGFRYPTPEVFKTFQNGEFSANLRDNISALPHLNAIIIEQAELTRKIQNDLEGVTFSDFEIKLVQTFDIGTPEPPCSLYEGLYRKESRVAVMLDISEFYKHFGLGMSKKEGKRELPDHLSAELEFLHFLTFKEAQARIDDNPEFLEGYLLAQKDFLVRHPIQWIPKLCDTLQNSAGVPFYAPIAKVTSMFITCELELVTSHLKNFCRK